MRRPSVLLAVLLIAAAAAPASPQRLPPPPPRLVLPEVPRPEPDQTKRPQFRSSVTRVEVSALVLDASGKPVRGLTADDFEILENGVPQAVRSFEPFTFQPDLVALPDPLSEHADPSKPRAPAPASNYYTSSSRIFALILDDLHVDVRRTRVAREAARRLVDQLAPADLLLVMTTGSAESTGYFTRDRRHPLRIIEGFTGQRLLDKRLASLRYPGHDLEAERLDHYERLCATIRGVSLALRDVTGRRKTVVLISEGSSFGAGMSDMTVEMPTPTNNLRANTPTGSSRAMNDALAAAAAGNVAIYPLNPAGLDVPDADIIQAPGLIRSELKPEFYSEILTEARQAKEMSRDLAALTGGVSLVDTNDALAGIDRAVRDASVHYVLSYEPQTPPAGTEYRRIEVKVRRPGLRVLARRGYRAAGAAPPPPMRIPGSLSPPLRTLLSGVMPDDGLQMRVHAVPIGGSVKTLTVAVVVEVNGTVLAAQRGSRALKIEQGLLTVDDKGRAANGTRRMFDVSLSPGQWEVLAATGLRTIWALELASGRYQLRVASLDATSNRGGSVYLNLDVAKWTAQPQDVLIASRLLSMMPTPFTDKRLAPWMAVMPTATRVFPQGDVLTVTLGQSSSGPATARLLNAAGELVWEASGSEVQDGSTVQFVVPLDGVAPGVYDLAIESGARPVRTVIGVVPAG
jgi:VWFA-related protein